MTVKQKNSCAGAYHSLSDRASNRIHLLKKSASAGLVNVVVGLKSWTIAKLCAIAISNLSMEPGGEAIMMKESVAMGIVILIGLEKNRLLPICLQALHNITCVEEW